MSKKAFKRIFLGFIALYFVIFTARVIYNLITFSDTDIAQNSNIYYQGEGLSVPLRNIASSKTEYEATGSATGGILDQKYERVASIAAKTVDYDNDFARLEVLVEEYRAIIQMENRTGLQGNRRANFMVGVRPEHFEDMEAEILKIGRVTSSTATKTDKTNEYRQLLAEKDTLEKRLESYNELKEKGGSISEMLEVEEKIIEVQALIQEQTVGLGEYTDENALCTINFTLSEGREAGALRKLWNALLWSTMIYFFIILGLLGITFVTFIILALWNYLKKTLVDKPEEKKVDEKGEAKEQGDNKI